jgi:hypothetical protein
MRPFPKASIRNAAATRPGRLAEQRGILRVHVARRRDDRHHLRGGGEVEACLPRRSGEPGGAAFNVNSDQDELWNRRQIVLDPVPGATEGFSLEALVGSTS